MAVPRPSMSDIDSAAEHFGFHLDADGRQSALGFVQQMLDTYDVIDKLYDEVARTPAPDRAYRFPAVDENPLGAWYVTTEIRSDGDGPLSGRRVAVKDNIAVAGVPMMNGSRAVEGFIPDRDATVVERLLAAGATIAGKSVCEDLCYSGSSFTSASGPVRNPWDTTRETGGSSSGSAALVAADAVDLAIGADQAGSIRIPASLCGIVGFKPTHGLVPYTGAIPLDRTIDHLGPMTRTVSDAALLLTVLAGTDGWDPRQPSELPSSDYSAALTGDVAGLRVGLLTEGFGHRRSQPEVDELVRAAAHRFTEIGCSIGEISVPWHGGALALSAVFCTEGGVYQMLEGNGNGLGTEGRYDPDLMAHFATQRRTHADQLSAIVKATAAAGYYGLNALGGSYYAKARNLVPHARAAYDDALARYDVLVMPATPATAQPLPEDVTSLYAAVGKAANTAPLNVTGHPAISVPAGLVDGLPAGMMIVGKRFDDATVLNVAHAFESLCGGFPSAPK
ncbi:amidase [Mycobacterium bourgelatii]|uniref:Amidase n=1 Tax=Mycobacterium bourgelatii TaxID=1273442 RepID=A0A7I9YW94_MYCBU|nr:amidase [Mycobacterium bourgelatii]MCV6975302.1 amidase [Mycobacterium bourgelatii]GFG92888.1 amidase [Mycobacterium bourgelatii]